jgi:DNA (cytosine-5)-methyltransferase 1
VFVEWLMGLPAGWVTGVPGLSRAAQLRVLGNGVVPAQASAALRVLLDYVDVGQEASA